MTGDVCAHAGPFLALISQRTGIAIVTRELIGRILTATSIGADVVGTWIIIVTFHRVADTGSFYAMIGNGAGIGIIAGAAVKHFIYTSLDSDAFVIRTIIRVVTQIHIVTV